MIEKKRKWNSYWDWPDRSVGPGEVAVTEYEIGKNRIMIYGPKDAARIGWNFARRMESRSRSACPLARRAC
jgi:hypothetical protein